MGTFLFKIILSWIVSIFCIQCLFKCIRPEPIIYSPSVWHVKILIKCDVETSIMSRTYIPTQKGIHNYYKLFKIVDRIQNTKLYYYKFFYCCYYRLSLLHICSKKIVSKIVRKGTQNSIFLKYIQHLRRIMAFLQSSFHCMLQYYASMIILFF